jgi:galactokinase
MRPVANADATVQTLFKRHFAYTPAHVVKAPGGLELLGSHTHDSDGLVLSVAVDKYIFIASAPRSDGRIELVCSAFPERELFWLSEIKKNPAAPWADGIKGVLSQLRKRGVHFSGFNAAVHGTIPMGLDLGGSAALQVATALTVRRLYPFSLTETGATIPPKRNEKGGLPPLPLAERMHFARLCRAAENEFIGAQCGIIGPVTSLFGKAWHVVNLDCRFLTIEYVPLIGSAIVVCDSGVRPSPVAGRSDELRQNCESAARKLGAKSLRSVELKYLREYECAYHVVSEIQRVVFAERALREDDHRQFGQFMFQGHESSRDSLKNSCPKLDLLVELARKHSGCLGARLVGSGFGGATVNLVAYHQAENFMEVVARQYEEQTGNKIKPVVCQIVDGAN